MTTIYLAIGNSDDKLTQLEWSYFIKDVEDRVVPMATEVYGRWFSAPDDPWQNACWALQFKSVQRETEAEKIVTEIRKRYRQDSAAWSIAETRFI